MKQKIALVTGGYSGESVISYKSAKTIYTHLDKNLYDVYVIDINPEGWFYLEDDHRAGTIDKNDFSLRLHGETIRFDGVFIGMHGTPGEDGRLQGYFDMLGLPYTSCNAATSALTFNKRYTVAVAAMAGIAVAPSVHLFAHTAYDVATILQQLQLPVFVKPNNGGSSIGMSKVSKGEELAAAIEKAFAEDNQVLVEQMIQGREFTVGVFKTEGQIQVLPITEVIAQNEFFDYEAKYHGASTEITPALIGEEWKANIEAAAKNIYAVCNCSGVVRIDFIYDEVAAKPYMLEINTVPGQSEASIIPQQVRAKGWTLQDFYSRLVAEALAKR
ncbi:D-alanine-D-alanine ligase [Cnuella takakiae]|uniref:D-alanine--D-alanine ligase n=1 Tax=Cnuella takakiae TaxID=1302690 RepID=A0A1M4VKH6_9BACT|nr:D-alanine--D-alanine ligase [Cnuella takakiae]OLY92571.1 D-alanine--D-alanine ligase A [Cnuella takakiae]SHE69380.1 D-alanine-D-alanine ligase [Cnuella takakiae]